MLDEILNFLKFLFGLYDAMPEDLKDKFKEKAADGFDGKFRDFFRANTGA